MSTIEKVVFVRPVQLPGGAILLRERVTPDDCRIEEHPAGILLIDDATTRRTVVPWGNIVEARHVLEPAPPEETAAVDSPKSKARKLSR